MEATLLDHVVSAAGRQLTLQAGRHIFNAVLEGASGGEALTRVRRGSLVQVTGVDMVKAERSIGSSENNSHPQIESFRLILRTPQDEDILRRPQDVLVLRS